MEDPFNITAPIPRRTMTMFYLVDTSGSMCGAKISALNTAVRESLPLVKDISKNNSDSIVKIAALEFSSSAVWMYPVPEDVDSFEWRDLQAGGMTALGAAYDELNKQLSASHGFMSEAKGSFAPVILLFSDGAPTDCTESALDKLKRNNWFRYATKIAIAIGDDCIKSTLIDFTGSDEAVLTVHNVDDLKKIIRLVSVTTAMVGTKTTSVGQGSESKQNEATTAINSAKNADPSKFGKIDVGLSSQNKGTDNWTGW